MRRFRLVICMLVAIAATANTGAIAMDEQRGPVPAGSDVPKADVQEQGTSKSEGTEIRIPGLGKLGTLPKMDFGLELLYGAAESRPLQDAEPEDKTDQQQDLMIHGTVKHRF